MNISTLIMVVFIVAICILPFALIYFNGQKKKAGFLNILKNLAEKHNSVISQYDLFKNSGIGIDVNKKHAFYFISSNDGIKEYEQNLAGIKKCKISKHSRSIKSSGDSISVIDKLDLAFENENGLVSSFPLFDLNQSMQIVNELEIATKWEKIFQANI